ncbi:unnamed protein product [Calypogeia fissa]
MFEIRSRAGPLRPQGDLYEAGASQGAARRVQILIIAVCYTVVTFHAVTFQVVTGRLLYCGDIPCSNISV